MTAPSTITHRGITIGISDELTFKMALLLWEDIAQQWGQIEKTPKDAPKPAPLDVTTSYVPAPETQVYVNTHPSPPLQLSTKVEKSSQGQTQKEKKNPSNKWQIPFNYKTQKKEYDVAWKLCKKWGLPYPEAVKKRDEERAKKSLPANPKTLPTKPDPVPTNPKSPNKNQYTKEQKELIWNCESYPEAIKAFNERYPDEHRSDAGIKFQWDCRPLSMRKSAEKAKAPAAGPTGAIVLPDELKPLEEKKAFFIGAQVKQVAGRTPHAMGTGDIIEIKANGDIVVEFYHERKTLKRDELAFYTAPNPNQMMKVRSS